MNPPCSKIAPPSLLHRMLRIAPGRAPAWVCSPDYCLGFDLLIAVQVAWFLSALLAAKMLHLPWLWIAAVILLAVFEWFIYLPFEQRERSARARVRRALCPPRFSGQV